MKAYGFTLIELLIVVVIISILATIAIPNLMNVIIKTKEEPVIAAMKYAIKIKHEENLSEGYDTWPADNPFTLIDPAPPNQYRDGNTPPDNYHWGYGEDIGYWVIYCPHWINNTKGKAWVYKYGTSAIFVQHAPGDFWLAEDKPH